MEHSHPMGGEKRTDPEQLAQHVVVGAGLTHHCAVKRFVQST